jgi:hypothetical protein
MISFQLEVVRQLPCQLLIFSTFSATSNLIFVPTRIVMRSPNLPYQLIPFFTLHLYSLTVIEVCTGVSVGAQHQMFIIICPGKQGDGNASIQLEP